VALLLLVVHLLAVDFLVVPSLVEVLLLVEVVVHFLAVIPTPTPVSPTVTTIATTVTSRLTFNARLLLNIARDSVRSFALLQWLRLSLDVLFSTDSEVALHF
jgi:hypothetical protein